MNGETIDFGKDLGNGTFSKTCPKCGKRYMRTPSGIACPTWGCSKLIPLASDRHAENKTLSLEESERHKDV